MICKACCKNNRKVDDRIETLDIGIQENMEWHFKMSRKNEVGNETNYILVESSIYFVNVQTVIQFGSISATPLEWYPHFYDQFSFLYE